MLANVHLSFLPTDKDHFDFMVDKLIDLPIIDPLLVQRAEASLCAVRPLCPSPEYIEYYDLLDTVVIAMRFNSLKGKQTPSEYQRNSLTD